MEAEPVVFKLDVSDKGIRRKAMKIVCKFSGITFVDVKEQGKLKIRGSFDKADMGIKLQKIDKFVAIIDPKQKAEQSHDSVSSSFPNRSDNPETQIAVYKFEVLSEKILREAYTVIWEFSGVTSVEVKGEDQLEVIGEFNNVEMSRKLKKIDTSVTITEVRQDVEDQEPFHKVLKGMQSFAGSSRVPTRERLIKNTSTFTGTGARAPERLAAPKANANTPINQQVAFGAQKHAWNNQVAFGAQNHAWNNQVAFGAQNHAWNNQIARRDFPIWKVEPDIEKEKEDKRKEEAEKKRRIEKEKEVKRKEEAEKKRIEKEKEDKRKEDERRRIRMAKEIADNQRSSAWNTGSGTSSQALTQGSKGYSSFVPSSSSMRNPYSSTQSTGSSSSMRNPYSSTQSNRTSGFTQSLSSVADKNRKGKSSAK